MPNYTEKPKKKRESRAVAAVDKFDMLASSGDGRASARKIKGKRPNPWQELVKNLIPMKGDSTAELIRKIIFLAAIVVLIATLVVLMLDLSGFSDDKKKNEDLASIVGGVVSVDSYPFNAEEPGIVQNPEEIGVETEEEMDLTPIQPTDINIDFGYLKSINSEVIGWINVPGTRVNHAVVQAADNDYYLTHNVYKEESQSGAIFADWRAKYSNGTIPDITVLYGHNMINGDAFGDIDFYMPNDRKKEPAYYYKIHPTIVYNTPNEKGVWKIFAGMLVNVNESDGEVFEYTKKYKFSDVNDFNNYMLEIMDRSWFFTDVDLTYGDKILVLSTCYYPLGKNVETRWVLFARKVRDGESNYVDTSVATRNYNAKLFDYYYNLWGGQWYGRTWDTKKLLSY